MPIMADTAAQLSVVIPCYNEDAVLPLLEKRLTQALNSLGLNWEVILVDDGSSDHTCEYLMRLNAADPRYKVISFSRNFGHQAAVAAGIHFASGNAVAVMDADLQDPPEILAQCIAKWREGYEVIYAVRRKRKEGIFKRAAYSVFYRLLKAVAEVDIPLDSGDFCLMDRRVVDALRALPERNIFVRGMRAWVGFRQIGITFEREARAAGETKYPFRKLVRLAMDGIFSFSTLPLRLAVWLGFFTVCLCLFLSVFILAWRLLGFPFLGHTAEELPGWTGIALGLFVFSGVQLLLLGIVGEYIGRIYTEVKSRPRWVVRAFAGLNENSPHPNASNPPKEAQRDSHLV